jgi:murein DD-endopeptidase MepM/ murein hydrolase activator NlpD
MWSGGIHKGTDQACPTGTKVVAPVDGVVVAAGKIGWGAAFGRHQVIIEFKARRNKLSPVKTYWVELAHMSANTVKIGQVVKKNQTIGKSGAEGNVTGPHMHTEVHTTRFWSKNTHINPQFVLDL